ncbi:hypothetical protein ACHHYP_01047 [Achlya hypogyna]|uniref:DEAD/DEAH box RNA helicase n=1 Tax=Achlya hypogyna TaxID=1202772 RepID=A0A1V9ZTR9_ACHHY|nr:hypothetical protein ACHHYP_01047 [Achlya hypogyna]
MQFADLPLSPAVQASLAVCGFIVPSPVQAKALPIALFGNDLIAQAKSGMGKTLVFATVAIELAVRSSTSWAMVLAPTREIALQIQHVLQTLLTPIATLDAAIVVACIGGLPIDDDERRLRLPSTRLVVGTPGRLKALVQRKSLPLPHVHLVVLDEVDKLLQGDFDGEMTCILSALPPSKQTIACSATFTPDQLASLAQQMHHPQFVCVRGPNDVTTEYVRAGEAAALRDREARAAPEVWLRGVQQRYVLMPDASDIPSAKLERLTTLLSRLPFHQSIVFCNDKFRTEGIATALSEDGFPAVGITGAQTQELRTAAMERFRACAVRVLVSTDLTARGIDVDRVNLVINMDLPRDPATYLHRVGRAGRPHGVAVTLLQPQEVPALDALAKLFKMTISELPDDMHIDAPEPPTDELLGMYAMTDLPAELYVRNPTPLPAAPAAQVTSPKAPTKKPSMHKAERTESPARSRPMSAQTPIPTATTRSTASTLVKGPPGNVRRARPRDPAYDDEEAEYEVWCQAFR